MPERRYTYRKYADRGWYIAVEFEPSRSPKFEKVVKMARKHPNHIEIVAPDGRIVYRNIYRREHLKLFWELFNMISGWKNVKIYIKGKEVPVYRVWMEIYREFQGESDVDFGDFWF